MIPWSRCRVGMTHRFFGAVLMVLGAALLGLGGAPVARAAEPAPVAATEAAPPPEQVRALIELLGDPQVRDWLREQLAEPSQPAVGQPAPMEVGTMGIAERRLEAIRGQLHAMAAAIPRLPSALAAAWTTLERDLSQTGIFWTLLLVGAFVGLGFGAQWL
jgi:hypothetical protein